METNNAVQIKNDSMRSLLTFMNGRMVSINESGIVKDGNILISLPREDNLISTVTFISETEVVFTIVLKTCTIQKTISRPAEFNGGLIEFSKNPESYFEEIYTNMNLGIESFKTFYKLYSCIN